MGLFCVTLYLALRDFVTTTAAGIGFLLLWFLATLRGCELSYLSVQFINPEGDTIETRFGPQTEEELRAVIGG